MNKYAVGRVNQPPALIVEGETIRQAILNFAEMADVGIKEKKVHKEDFAFVRFHRYSYKESCVIVFSAV